MKKFDFLKILEIFRVIRKTNLSLIVAVVYGGIILFAILSAKQAITISSLMKETNVYAQNSNILKISVEKRYLTTQEIELLKNKILSQDVRAEAVMGNTLKIVVNDINKYEEFRSAIRDVLNAEKGTRWEVVKMCAGSLCPGEAYNIEMKGYRLSLTAL